MVSRRRFIETTVAGSLASGFAAWDWAGETGAIPAHPQPGSARSSGGAIRAPLHAAVFDERFAEAVRFGRAIERHGVAARGIPGDVTDLWYSELHPLWKREAAPIAGLTPYATLFCLERLAWDHRMRVVYHGTHTRLASGDVEHVLHGPEPRSERGRRRLVRIAAGERADWPAEIASIISRMPWRPGSGGMLTAGRTADARFLVHGSPSEQGVGEALHSWLIAPPARS